MTWAMVAVGAAIGAPLRYLTDRFVQARHDTVFAWGTLTANVSGSLILGVLTGVVATRPADDWLAALVGTGLCGALTTYSTFSYETLQLATGGARLYALANLIGTLVAGLSAFYVGSAVAQVIWG